MSKQTGGLPIVDDVIGGILEYLFPWESKGFILSCKVAKYLGMKKIKEICADGKSAPRKQLFWNGLGFYKTCCAFNYIRYIKLYFARNPPNNKNNKNNKNNYKPTHSQLIRKGFKVACRYGSLDVMEYLLRESQFYHTTIPKDILGLALLRMARRGVVRGVDMILTNGHVDVNYKLSNTITDTAITLAGLGGHSDVVKMLLKLPNISTNGLFSSAIFGRNKELIEFLWSSRSCVEYIDDVYTTAVGTMALLKKNKMDCVHFALRPIDALAHYGFYDTLKQVLDEKEIDQYSKERLLEHAFLTGRTEFEIYLLRTWKFETRLLSALLTYILNFAHINEHTHYAHEAYMHLAFLVSLSAEFHINRDEIGAMVLPWIIHEDDTHGEKVLTKIGIYFSPRVVNLMPIGACAFVMKKMVKRDVLGLEIIESILGTFARFPNLQWGFYEHYYSEIITFLIQKKRDDLAQILLNIAGAPQVITLGPGTQPITKKSKPAVSTEPVSEKGKEHVTGNWVTG